MIRGVFGGLVSVLLALGCGEGGDGYAGGFGVGASATAVTASVVAGGPADDCKDRVPVVEPVLGAGDVLQTDVDLTCETIHLGRSGLSLAMNELHTLVASGGGEGDVFDVTPGNRSHWIVGLHGELGVAAASPNDTVAVAGITGFASAMGGIDAYWGSGYPSTQLQLDAELESRRPRFHDVALTPAGVLHAWHARLDDPTSIHEATSDPAATYGVTLRPLTIPGGVGTLRFSLTPGGQTVVFNATPAAGELLARVGDATSVIRAASAHPVTDFRAAGVAHTASTRDYAVSILDDVGLHVAVAGAEELTIPGVVPWRTECARDGVPAIEGACPATCHEISVGAMPRGHAIAFLDGDRVLVAYVEKRADTEFDVGLSEDGTLCIPSQTDDDSRYDVVGLRIDPTTGAIDERFRIAITRFPDPDEGEGDAIDIATVGNDVGVAVRTEFAGAWRIRVMRATLAPG